MTTINTNAGTLGYVAHNNATRDAMQRILTPMIAEAETTGVELTQDTFNELIFHPEIIALNDLINEELYIAEYVTAVRAIMAEMGLTDLEGAKNFIALAEAQLAENLSTEHLTKLKTLYGERTERCYEALYASFTN